MGPSVTSDTLALAVAALDSLRNEHERLTEKLLLLEAGLLGSRDKAEVLKNEFTSSMSALEGRLSRRIELLEAGLLGSRDKAEVLKNEFTSSISALEGRLSRRIEFVRAETMFETRAQVANSTPTIAPGQGGTRLVNKHVIDSAKVESQLQAGALRLNIGCGHIPLEGYVNIDMRSLPGVDAVAEATDLPFDHGSVAEIYSSHLLEHFPIEHLRRVVLPHWKDLLRPNGELRSVVPDAEAMLNDYARGEMSFDCLREVTFGLQEYEGDFHYTMFTSDSLAVLLREVGFDQITLTFQGRKNGNCRDMEVRAAKN
jgi:hypothetical protein